MPKFCRKPGQPVEAVQWNYNPGDLVEDADKYPMVKWGVVDAIGCAFIETMHAGQKVFLEKGDWILPEPDGVHFYPCKPDIFEKTYEPAEPPRLSVPEGFEFTEADLRSPGFVVYEPGMVAAVEAQMRDAAIYGEGVVRITHEPVFVGIDHAAAGSEKSFEVKGERLPGGKLRIDSIEEVTSAPIDPATPTCEYCGARVRSPCSDRPKTTDRLHCELPRDTVYADDRRKNMIGGPGVAIGLDDPRHPVNRDTIFVGELQRLINSHSRENGSDTPDFLLAPFLFHCLTAFDNAVTRRSSWYDDAGKIKTLAAKVRELEDQLQAEGEHTEAANARIDELQRAMDASLLDGQ